LIVVEAVKGARRTTWHLDVTLDQEDFLEALEDILAVFKPQPTLHWDPEFNEPQYRNPATTMLGGASPGGRASDYGDIGVKGDDSYASLKPPIELPHATDIDTFDEFPPGDS